MQSFIKQLTKEQAIELYNSKVWESWIPEQIAKFQLYQECLCVPFSEFHIAVEKTLGRSVWSHEFAYTENLQRELEGILGAPSMQEIMDMLPKDKTIFFDVDE